MRVRRSRRQFLAATGVLATSGVFGLRNPVRAEQPAEQPAFGDVPRSHPAYSILAWLESTSGAFTGELDGVFSGEKVLSRDELALGIFRTFASFANTLNPVAVKQNQAERRLPKDPAKPADWHLDIPPQRRQQLQQVLADPEQRQRVLAWYEPLLTEFAPELKLMALSVDEMRGLLSRWRAELPVPIPKERPVTEQLFEDVPLAHPGYAVATWMQRWGLFVPLRESCSNRRAISVRYEFVQAIHYIHYSVTRHLDYLRLAKDPDHPQSKRSGRPHVIPARGPAGFNLLNDTLLASLADREQRRRLMAWYAPLLTDFEPELAMMGADFPKLRKVLDR